ncbi:MAG: integral rane sensor signal transduction histidine kinase [Jatrophihabitantaceae bacterium]|nr:integral rane sensor signal transduction histidine kinase [Jatrophihabitantaceae bacterium]
MTPRTLRAKLALTVAAMTALGLVAAALLTFAVFRQGTLGEVDRQLRSGAPTLARLIQAVANGSGPRSQVQDRVSQRLLGSSGGTVAALRGDDGAVRKAWVLGVVDDPASPELAALVPNVPRRDLARARAGVLLISADGHRTALIRVPTGVVQVSVPDAATRHALRRLLVVEAAVAAAVLLAVACGGWLLVRRELRPLEQIARSADRIAAGEPLNDVRPGLASGAATAGSEVSRVAEALDAMIAQVGGSLTASRLSEAQLRSFVLDAAHELRTPLTSIRGYAELFDRGLADHPEDLAVALRRIAEESVRLGALLDDLLLLARLDGSPEDAPLALARIDLRVLLRDAAADARAADPARPVAVLEPPDAVDAQVDADRIRQLLANLVRNALVHTPSGTPLTLSVAAVAGAAGWAEIRVADAGPGIAVEQRARIFDRFARLDAGRSRDAGGSGLGLAIVAAIAGAHGGRVWALETPGGGATLCVALPLNRV